MTEPRFLYSRCVVRDEPAGDELVEQLPQREVEALRLEFGDDLVRLLDRGERLRSQIVPTVLDRGAHDAARARSRRRTAWSTDVDRLTMLAGRMRQADAMRAPGHAAPSSASNSSTSCDRALGVEARLFQRPDLLVAAARHGAVGADGRPRAWIRSGMGLALRRGQVRR